MHTGFSLSLVAPAKLTVKGLQRPAPRIGLDKLVADLDFTARLLKQPPPLRQAVLTIQLKTVLEKEHLNYD